MTAWRSGLYAGRVTHRRLRPRHHRLGYKIFQVLLDLDELPDLDRRLRLFSRGRFNLFGFYDRDHGDGAGDLRVYVRRVLDEAGIAFDDGPVRLLCMPRMLGYVFNPISLFFCHARSGDLVAILYEVNNTFGQRHSYLFPVHGADSVVRHECAKAFYVSPFMTMDMDYAFEAEPPGARVSTVIRGSDDDGLLITAAFAGERSELSDAVLLRAFVAHPLLTLMVVAGIHWEAIKILLKGVRMTRRPPAPAQAISVASDG